MNENEVTTQEFLLSQNVINAIYTVNASGAIVDEETIKLMVQVDSGQISDEVAVLKIMQDESLIAL